MKNYHELLSCSVHIIDPYKMYSLKRYDCKKIKSLVQKICQKFVAFFLKGKKAAIKVCSNTAKQL